VTVEPIVSDTLEALSEFSVNGNVNANVDGRRGR